MSVPPRRIYRTHNAAVDAQLSELVVSVADTLDRELLREMLVSVYRLGEDKASTGDLKILNSALKELRYAFDVFQPYRHIRKVALFGSARLGRSHPAYKLAQEFGRLIAEAGWAVITGAASGIMRAGHEGAGRTASFGLNIRLPFEQEANPVIASDKKLVTCKYFFTRKLLFIKESHATVLFPGGFGTLDEGFESLTLVQTGKSDPRPIIFVQPPQDRYWQPLLDYIRHMADEKTVSPADLSIYQVAHSADEAQQMILDFYRIYHSIRYVGRSLAMRLVRAIPDSAVRALSAEFRDILTDGEIRLGSALPEEADEPELKDLPRLVIPFNRQSYGRLYEIIHRINLIDKGAEPGGAPSKK